MPFSLCIEIFCALKKKRAKEALNFVCAILSIYSTCECYYGFGSTSMASCEASTCTQSLCGRFLCHISTNVKETAKHTDRGRWPVSTPARHTFLKCVIEQHKGQTFVYFLYFSVHLPPRQTAYVISFCSPWRHQAVEVRHSRVSYITFTMECELNPRQVKSS